MHLKTRLNTKPKTKPKTKSARLHPTLALVLLLAGLGGCGSGSSSNQTLNPGQSSPGAIVPDAVQPLPRVVVTTSILCNLTQQIAATTVDLTCLIEPGQDPHSYKPIPSDRKAIDQADLILYGGYDLEPGLIALVTARDDTAVKVAVYEAAVPDPLFATAHDHGDDPNHDDPSHDDPSHDDPSHDDPSHDDPSHDDKNDHQDDNNPNHGLEVESGTNLVPDPHIWHDALNNSQIATIISAQLQQLNPQEGDRYRTATSALVQEFTDLDGWIKTQVATVPPDDRRLITTHSALGYFAHRYGFQDLGAISGLSGMESLSASRLVELVEILKQAQVTAIFTESTANPRLIATLSQDSGVKVAEPPLQIEGPREGDTVQEMLQLNTCTIVNALGGTCTP
ncbi:Mn transporter MntC [Prochlorothrix hollandica PCC 9006 = CALU 1027]|uniref:Mn transporter MntC n=1 Tax=Prochlorothrix hollandica PCC 9006 = CALU 1027 TaxID=317619 RepID=A0A0M2PW92_PROHO|nr:Mn transporter MntC [Prochlorothrix hollandica PCC 9006 = CALU 1027]